MYGLVLLKLGEESIEGFEVVGGGVAVEVEYGGQGEAEQEVVGGTASLVALRKGGETGEVGLGEE